MVRYINKDLKAHKYQSDEKISDILDIPCFYELIQLFTFHTRDFGGYSHDKSVHLFQKLTIQQSITRPTDFENVISYQHTKLKELFLTLEIILESFHEVKDNSPHLLDFIAEVNELFLIHKVPLQVRYFSEKEEFFVEKIISREVSEQIKKTLENFSEKEKVFEDFKEAIEKYSSGDYEGSIEKCCVSIEDYLCLLLEKQTCSSVVQYYKDVAKKLKISDEINDRFVNIIHFIHNHRSPQNHGAIEKKEIEDEELVSEIIIGFTMTILNYLKKKNEI